jgi:hypothetical protein
MSDKFSPLSGNSFQSRDDVVRAFHALFEPLLAKFSPECATVQIDQSGAVFDRAAISLEGFARPLWGIVPLVLGGEQFAHWDVYRKGLTNGTNPNHPEYWGEISDTDQRQVELAAIGWALACLPQHIWDPLDETAKQNLTTYLVQGRNMAYPECNWKFFRILVDIGLRRVGAAYDEKLTNEAFEDVERYYIKDGWYRDGDPKGELLRIDYYNPFAMHLYGLLYAVACPEDKDRCQRYRERARKFALQYSNFFADDGACVPYGRSLTYRFACGSFWGALAYADEQPLPWGTVKGFYMRHLRWWSEKPISSNNTNLLSIGYGYPNTFMSEGYNSACSPYWAMKAFIPLALPATHPFWQAKELPLEIPEKPIPLDVTGMVAQHSKNNSVLLVSGPERKHMRFVAEKYNKFAYSSRYAFSVESDARRFDMGVFDSMLAFSDDGAYFRVRERCVDARISGTTLYSLWKPWEDVDVETWLIPSGLWHIRVHRVKSPRKLSTLEGGFAVPLSDFRSDKGVEAARSAWVEVPHDCSGIVDLSPSSRTARLHRPEGNTNILFPRSTVPQLKGTISPGETTILITAVLASPDKSAFKQAWTNPPSAPPMSELDLIAKDGDLVGIFKY